MKETILIILLMGALVGCTDEKRANRVLENDGFTEIIFTGYEPFECSEDDTFHTGFKAKKGGREVKGCVCSGILKGATIRFE